MNKKDTKIYFHMDKDGDVWKVNGELETKDMKDMLDIIMILMTNAVRVAMQITDLSKSSKPMRQALTAQLDDIIKSEIALEREAQGIKGDKHAKSKN